MTIAIHIETAGGSEARAPIDYRLVEVRQREKQTNILGQVETFEDDTLKVVAVPDEYHQTGTVVLLLPDSIVAYGFRRGGVVNQEILSAGERFTESTTGITFIGK